MCVADLESDLDVECDCLEGWLGVNCTYLTKRCCKEDPSACVEYPSWGILWREDFVTAGFYNEFLYVEGPSAGTSVYAVYDWNTGSCSVSVDGNACSRCSYRKCGSGSFYIHVDCSNVQDDMFYDGCSHTFHETLEVLDRLYYENIEGYVYDDPFPVCTTIEDLLES